MGSWQKNVQVDVGCLVITYNLMGQGMLEPDSWLGAWSTFPVPNSKTTENLLRLNCPIYADFNDHSRKSTAASVVSKKQSWRTQRRRQFAQMKSPSLENKETQEKEREG
jgi:hypothetical protein